MTKSQQRKELIPITPETMAKALRESDDFGHEMRVRTLLENHRGAVTHGGSYHDPYFGRPRQFDFRFELRHALVHSGRVLTMAIECKNLSSEAPLVVTGIPRSEEESFHHVVASGPRQYSMMQYRHVYSTSERDTAYPVGGFVGKSLLRLQRSKDGKELVPARDKESEVYDRWSQAVSSAHELCRQAIDAKGVDGSPCHTVILPGVVVPDGTLWSVQYDSEGNCGSGPVHCISVELFLNHEVEIEPENHRLNLSHVHFWTISGFKRFLDKLTAKGAEWNEWFPTVVRMHTPPDRAK